MNYMSELATKNRALIEALEIARREHGIRYTFFSDGWVIKLQKGNKTQLIHAYSSLNLNLQASLATAQDKVCTYELLSGDGVRAVPHWLLTSQLEPAVKQSDVEALLVHYGSIVVKPTLGMRGALVAKFTNASDLLQYTYDNQVASWAASPYINIQQEIRTVVLDNQVVFAYEKHNPTTRRGLRMFNITLGATMVPIDPATLSEDMRAMALQSVRALGLRFAAVDIVFDEQGEAFVLEVNTAFSLERYALTSVAAKVKVVDFYTQLVKDLFKNE
jgi:glutathione synthase/RimK-type ligase-like ATP-grasp enzyme